jgi:hypothetical protein
LYESILENVPEEHKGPRFVEKTMADPDSLDLWLARRREDGKKMDQAAQGKRRIVPRGDVRKIDHESMERFLTPGNDTVSSKRAKAKK